MSSLTLDLDFTIPEPPSTSSADIPSEWLVTMEDMVSPPELMIEQHRVKMVKPEDLVWPKAAFAHRLGLDHHMYAFISQAKCCGLSDPALVPVSHDSAGRALYDEAELARFANELLDRELWRAYHDPGAVGRGEQEGAEDWGQSMNVQFQRMISASDRNTRARFAAIVQADIDRMGREYLALAERQHLLTSQLLAAGITHIPGTDEVISLEGIEDKETKP